MAEISGEMNYAAIFNIFMYTDYRGTSDNMTLSRIVEDMGRSSKYNGTSEYQILKQAVERDSALGNYRIQGQTWDKGSDSARTEACVFTDGNGTNYVVYRGTMDREWIDNGESMFVESTGQQELAADYFDLAAERFGWTSEDNIIVCGHSKGGNKAQYVTMASDYRDLIDSCYSLDGEGFSPEAIAAFKAKYGEEQYQEYINKMYSLRGENDYVSGLGIPIIPKDEEHTFFIGTSQEPGDFAGYHELKYMMDAKTGLLNETTEQGALSKFSDRLSEEMMKLPVDERREYAMTIMQLMESLEGESVGYDGRQATLQEILGFADGGIPFLLHVLLFTEEGREFLRKDGKDIVRYLIKNLGPAKTALVALALLFGVPLVHKGVSILNSVLDFCEDVKNLVKNVSNSLKTMLSNLMEEVRKDYNNFVNWLKGKDVNATYDYFQTDLLVFQQIQSDLQRQQQQVSDMLEELKGIRSSMDFGMKAQIHISVMINNNILKLQALSNYLKQMQKCLGTAQQTYRTSEQRIANAY